MGIVWDGIAKEVAAAGGSSQGQPRGIYLRNAVGATNRTTDRTRAGHPSLPQAVEVSDASTEQ